MAQKRLTNQEKCDIMLKMFHAKRDFFHYKDIEKYSVKKGIVLQTVKEILQSLIDDNLVVQEKLGIANYYWSFVKDEGLALMDKKNELEKNIIKTKNDLVDLRKKMENEKIGREESDERNNLINTLNEKSKILEDLNNEMKKYAECDPRVFLQKKEMVEKCKKDINKLTDDIYSIQSYVCNKFGMERSEFNKNFGVSDDMDYIE